MDTKSKKSQVVKDKKSLLGLKFGEILLALDKISGEDLESLLIAQSNTTSRLGEFLLQRNLITEDDLLQVLAYQLGLEYNEDLLRGSSMVISNNLSRAFIKRYNVLILRDSGDTVEIAINDPFQFDVIENIKVFTKKNVKLILAKKLDILKLSDMLSGETCSPERTLRVPIRSSKVSGTIRKISKYWEIGTKPARMFSIWPTKLPLSSW
jgi:type IV pilus assembly protein PilB